MQRLIQTYHEASETGLRGVFTALNVPIRPSYDSVKLPTTEVLLKERQFALNWFIPRDVYEQVGPFVDAGIAYDTEYCRRLAEQKLPVICLKPSYVQNIGYHGAYQGAYQDGDLFTARDYVGRRDLYLRSRDAWYYFKRRFMNVARKIKHMLWPSKTQRG